MQDEYTHVMTNGDGSKGWLIQLKGGSFTWTHKATERGGVIFLGANETLEKWAADHGHTVRKFKPFTGNI